MKQICQHTQTKARQHKSTLHDWTKLEPNKPRLRRVVSNYTYPNLEKSIIKLKKRINKQSVKILIEIKLWHKTGEC